MATAPSVRASRLELLPPRRIRGATKLVLATVLTGLLAGVGSIGFHYVADSNVLLAWCESHKGITLLPSVLVVPTIGLFLIGIVLQFVPEGRVGGVKEVFEALERFHAVIPWWLMIPLGGYLLAWHFSLQHEAIHGWRTPSRKQRHNAIRRHPRRSNHRINWRKRFFWSMNAAPVSVRVIGSLIRAPTKGAQTIAFRRPSATQIAR